MPEPDFEIRGGGGSGHPDPQIRGGGRSPKKLFWALRASVWSKSKGAQKGRVPPLDPPLKTWGTCLLDEEVGLVIHI